MRPSATPSIPPEAAGGGLPRAPHTAPRGGAAVGGGDGPTDRPRTGGAAQEEEEVAAAGGCGAHDEVPPTVTIDVAAAGDQGTDPLVEAGPILRGVGLLGG